MPRPFSLSLCLAALGTAFGYASALGQDTAFDLIDQQAWETQAVPIGQYEVGSDNWVSEDFSRFVRGGARLYGDVDYISMFRRDEITFFDPFDASVRDELETGFNNGLRLRINYDGNAVADNVNAARPTFQFAMLQNEGDGEANLQSEDIFAQSSLTSIGFAAGTTTRGLGGQRRLMIGGRWMTLNDDYQYTITGFGSPTDWVSAENSILSLDFVGEQQFLWRNFEFEVGFHGGLGFNQTIGQNRFLINPNVIDESHFVTLTEIHAGASWKLNQFAAVHAGLAAIRVTNVYLARDLATRRVEPDTLEMLGFTLGLRYSF